MIVQNINISKFTSVLASDVLSSFGLLDSDFIKNQGGKNYYCSSKLNMNDLSNAYEAKMNNNDEVVYGQWTFNKRMYVQYPKLDNHIVNLQYMSEIELRLNGLYSQLTNDWFTFGKQQSYKGLIIATSLSSEPEVKEYYGGKTWKLISAGRFIVGATANTNYGIPNKNEDGQDTIYLTKEQCGIQAHSHDYNGGTFNGNKAVNLGNRVMANIQLTQHSKAGSSRPAYSAGLLQAYLKGRMSSTSKTYTFSGTSASQKLDKALAPFSNKPYYVPLYFWERTS